MMNNPLQQAVAKLIEKAISSIDTATTFLQGQLPDYVHQLLLWYGVKNFIFAILAFATLLTWFLYLEPKAWRMCKTNPEFRRDFWFYYLFVGSFIGRLPLAAIVIALGNLEWLQIWLAPKVWLVEYAKEFVK